jgi:hypothetical protein
MLRIDFLKKMLAGAVIGKLPINETAQFRKMYLLQFFIAGFSYYEGVKNLDKMQAGDLLELVREPNNEFDECAIALYWNKLKIGFVPAHTNEMLSYLLDADALTLFGTITHLQQNTKSWENVAVAIYFLQDANKALQAHANYLTRIEAPHYKTLSNKNTNTEDSLDELFENTNRVINLDTINPIHTDAKKDLAKFKKIQINKAGNYVLVATDDIYTYLYDIADHTNKVNDIDGNEFIEFYLL